MNNPSALAGIARRVTSRALLGGLAGLCLSGVLLAAGGPVRAMEIFSADDLDIRWDNTIRYSIGYRLQAPNALILGYPNADDGDRNFQPGLMTNRLDLLSVLDVTKENFGLQLSLAAWYDGLYFSPTGNNSPATVNSVSAPGGQFSSAAKNLDGRHADLGDSFIYGNFTLGEIPVSLRFGRQTLLWGESLFFDQNSIEAGMAPVDYIKKTSTPDGYSRSVFLPVNQLSLTVQPAPDISVMAYYQFEWRASRLPAIGSYFSDNDVRGAGAERAYLNLGQYLTHAPDHTPPDGGQYGFSLHKRIDDLDLGLYALHFHAKYPLQAAVSASPAASGAAGYFYSAFPKNIDLYGASFSAYLGASNVAGELSLRRNMPLVSISPVSLTVPAGLNYSDGYARGDTLHGQVSAVMTLGPQFFWDSADFSLELAANDRLAITEDAAAFNPGRTRLAASVRFLFQPHYFQLLPNLDVTPLLGMGFNFTGRSSTDYTQNAGTGDAEIGFSALYQSVWKVDLTLTSFAGLAYRQTLTDRDFLMFSLERTF